MFKKIILSFFIFIISLFFQTGIFAEDVKVENIFSDINSNYKYLEELQFLFDR